MCLPIMGCISALDGKSLAELQGENKGVVFLGFYFPTERCITNNYGLAVDTGTEYEIKLNTLRPGWPAKLDAGEYHVVSVSCAVIGSGAREYKTLTGKTGGTFRTRYGKSYAKFSVGPGEVVSVGVLGLHTKDNTVHKLEVRDFSDADKAHHMKEFPNLFSKAKTRLMDAKLRTPGDS